MAVLRIARRATACLAGLAAAGLLLHAGCGEEGVLAPNQLPDTRITSSSPAEGGSVAHHVEILFSGGDFDGTIAGYEYLVRTYPRAIDNRAAITVVPPDPNDPGWTRVSVARVELVLAADTLRADPRGDIGDGEFDRWHTFFVRSVDNDGDADPSPAQVTFRAFTQAPEVWLNRPADFNTGVTLPRTFVMNWDGADPIGNRVFQDVAEARWTFQRVQVDAAGDPIGYPNALYDLPDSAWSDWVRWDSPDSLGREAVFRDVVPFGVLDEHYVFALQGRDDGGAVTPKFTREGFRMNNWEVITVNSTMPFGPRLTVDAEGPALGPWTFDGTMAGSITETVAGIDTVTMNWNFMETAHYGANRGDYRFGWNIVNPANDDEWTAWDVVRQAPPHALQAGGTDEFRVQARDHVGIVTTCIIRFVSAARR